MKTQEMRSSADCLLINSAFEHDHSSSPIWLALAQGIEWAKNPWPLAPEEAPMRHDQAQEVTVEARLALACTSTLAFGLLTEVHKHEYRTAMRSALSYFLLLLRVNNPSRSQRSVSAVAEYFLLKTILSQRLSQKRGLKQPFFFATSQTSMTSQVNG